jgi:hypothetical protein
MHSKGPALNGFGWWLVDDLYLRGLLQNNLLAALIT